MIMFEYHYLKCLIIKKVEFANSVDPNEAAHHELPQLDLHCLIYTVFPLVLNPEYDKGSLDKRFFFKFCRHKICVM